MLPGVVETHLEWWIADHDVGGPPSRRVISGERSYCLQTHSEEFARAVHGVEIEHGEPSWLLEEH